MKFRINGKEWKALLDKAGSNIKSKCYLEHLNRIYLYVDGKTNRITATTIQFPEQEVVTQLDVYADVTCENKEDVAAFSISIEDVKLINKFKVDIDIIVEDCKLTFFNGKKTINIACRQRDESDPEMLKMDSKKVQSVISMTESEFLETFSTLKLFIDEKNVNKLMNTFYIDTEKNRIVSLDGHSICVKHLENNNVVTTGIKVMAHVSCLNAFKKVLNKKSESTINVFYDGKYINVEGKEFSYIMREVDGNYFNIDQFFDGIVNHSIYLSARNAEEWHEVVKEYNSIIKDSKEDHRPIVFMKADGKMCCYCITKRCECFDILEVSEDTVENDFAIAFNPAYLEKAFSFMKEQDINIEMYNSKAPMLLKNGKYTTLVLPVNFSLDKVKENIKKNLEVTLIN